MDALGCGVADLWEEVVTVLFGLAGDGLRFLHDAPESGGGYIPLLEIAIGIR